MTCLIELNWEIFNKKLSYILLLTQTLLNQASFVSKIHYHKGTQFAFVDDAKTKWFHGAKASPHNSTRNAVKGGIIDF